MRRASPNRSSSEAGFTMVAVIFMLAIFALAIAVAAPEMAKQIQLDREHETIERGKQYVRAIQLYYRKFNAYPPNIKALLETDNIRFLRQKYKDPLTGKDDWRIIHFGEAKVPPMGFFGQPLAGSPTALAGTGPSGGNMQQGGSAFGGGTGSSMGGGIGGGGSMGSSFGGGMGSSFGGGTGSSMGGSSGPSFGGGSIFGSNSGTSTTTGTTGSTGQTGTSTTGGSSTTGTGSTGSSMFGSGSGNQTFGGAGIIGVAPKSTKQSLMIYHKQDHYNMWEFVYNPLTDIQTTAGSSGLTGQPAGGGSNTNSPFGGSATSFGSSGSGIGSSGSGTGFGNPGSGGSMFGGSGSGFGGTSPTPSPAPQQQQ